MSSFFFTNNNLLLTRRPDDDLAGPFLQQVPEPVVSTETRLADYTLTFSAPESYRSRVTHYAIEEAHLPDAPFQGYSTLKWQRIVLLAVADLPEENRDVVTYNITARPTVPEYRRIGRTAPLPAGTRYSRNMFFYRVRAFVPGNQSAYSYPREIQPVYTDPALNPRTYSAYPGDRCMLLVWPQTTELPPTADKIFKYQIEITRVGLPTLGMIETSDAETELWRWGYWNVAFSVEDAIENGVTYSFRVRPWYLFYGENGAYVEAGPWSESWTGTPVNEQRLAPEHIVEVCSFNGVDACEEKELRELPRNAHYKIPLPHPVGVNAYYAPWCEQFCTVPETPEEHTDWLYIDITLSSLHLFAQDTFPLSIGVTSKRVTTRKPWCIKFVPPSDYLINPDEMFEIPLVVSPLGVLDFGFGGFKYTLHDLYVNDAGDSLDEEALRPAWVNIGTTPISAANANPMNLPSGTTVTTGRMYVVKNRERLADPTSFAPDYESVIDGEQLGNPADRRFYYCSDREHYTGSVRRMKFWTFAIPLHAIKTTYNVEQMHLTLYAALCSRHFLHNTWVDPDYPTSLEHTIISDQYDEISGLNPYAPYAKNLDLIAWPDSGGSACRGPIYISDSPWIQIPGFSCRVTRVVNGVSVFGNPGGFTTTRSRSVYTGKGVYGAKDTIFAQPYDLPKLSYPALTSSRDYYNPYIGRNIERLVESDFFRAREESLVYGTLMYKHFDRQVTWQNPSPGQVLLAPCFDLKDRPVARISVEKYGSVMARATTVDREILIRSCFTDVGDLLAGKYDRFVPTEFLEALKRQTAAATATTAPYGGEPQSVYNDEYELFSCGCIEEDEPACPGTAPTKLACYSSLNAIPIVQQWCLKQRTEICIARFRYPLCGGGAAWRYRLYDLSLRGDNTKSVQISAERFGRQNIPMKYLPSQGERTFAFFEATMPLGEELTYPTGVENLPIRTLGLDELPVKPTQLRLELRGSHTWFRDLRVVLKGPDGTTVFEGALGFLPSRLAAAQIDISSYTANPPTGSYLRCNLGFKGELLNLTTGANYTEWWGNLVLSLHTGLLPDNYTYNGTWTLSVLDGHAPDNMDHAAMVGQGMRNDELTLYGARLGFITNSQPWTRFTLPPSRFVIGDRTINAETATADYVLEFSAEPANNGSETSYIIEERHVPDAPPENAEQYPFQQIAVITVADYPPESRINFSYVVTNRQAISGAEAAGTRPDGTTYPLNWYQYRLRAVAPTGISPPLMAYIQPLF